MGFSTIGASVIIFAGILLFSYTLTNHLFEAQRDYNKAIDEDRDRQDFIRHTNMTMSNGNHGFGKLHLNMTNNGDTVLDVSVMAILLDGTWATDDVDTWTVNGGTTNMWAPGQTLYMRITAAAEPSRAYLVAESGHGVLWTP